jgi:phosphosulfolactate synthase (CoM biosynthesis protein A)
VPKYLFSEIKARLDEMIADGLEPELSLFMYGKEYMIIGLKDRFSFQRCGTCDGSGEVYYNTLDELYNSITIDNILLKRDWNDISSFECVDYEWQYEKEF